MGQCCSTGNSKNLDEIHLINQNDDEEITESSQKKKKSLRETLELLDPGVKYDIEFDTVSFWGRFSKNLQINNLGHAQADVVLASQPKGSYLIRPSTLSQGKVTIPRVQKVYEILETRPKTVSLDQILEQLRNGVQLDYVKETEAQVDLYILTISAVEAPKKIIHSRTVFYDPFIGSNSLLPEEKGRYFFFGESTGLDLNHIQSLTPSQIYKDKAFGFEKEALGRFKRLLGYQLLRNINVEAILQAFPDQGKGYEHYVSFSGFVKEIEQLQNVEREEDK